MMAQSTRSGRIGRSEATNGLLMISPTAIYATLLLAAPLAMIFAYSFMTDGYLTIIKDFQTCNYYGECISYKTVDGAQVEASRYLGVWSDPRSRALLLRSLLVALAVTTVTVLTAYPVAYFVSFHVAPSKKSLWLFLITIPFWTSYLIRIFLWKVILGFNGVVNSTLLGLGVISEPLQAINYSLGAVVTALAHAYAPFAILPIFVALEKIDRSFLEAGRDLGETPFMTFIRVTLPLSMAGVISSVLIVFIPTIGDYVTPHLLGGPEGKLVANLIEVNYKKLDNYPMGSALAISAMMMVVAVSLLFLFVNRRFLKGNK
jgi:spermidine/putrescine transport system permease protein